MTSLRAETRRGTPGWFRCVTSPSGTAPLRRCRRICGTAEWAASATSCGRDDGPDCASSVPATSKCCRRGPSGTATYVSKCNKTVLLMPNSHRPPDKTRRSCLCRIRRCELSRPGKCAFCVRVHRPPPQSPDTTKQSCLCRRPA